MSDIVERLADHDHLQQRDGFEALLQTASEAKAEIKRLRTLLKEAREELASHVEHEYPKPLRDIYPSMSRKYERDMDLCYRIDAALIDKEV